MSFESKGLHNLAFLPRYERILAENLPDGFTQFAEFFSGPHRLATLGAVLSAHDKGTGSRVLNVGSGPFATEIFVAALAGRQITAIDYTPEFARFYELFQAEGHLATTRFEQADIMEKRFEPGAFDLIILHDVLYEHALDLELVIARLLPALAGGGLVFFDFVNARTGWIWSLLGRGNRYRRYDPATVRAFLADAGLEIIDWRPTHSNKSLSAKVVHAALRVFGASNNYAVLVRKRDV